MDRVAFASTFMLYSPFPDPEQIQNVVFFRSPWFILWRNICPCMVCVQLCVNFWNWPRFMPVLVIYLEWFYPEMSPNEPRALLFCCHCSLPSQTKYQDFFLLENLRVEKKTLILYLTARQVRRKRVLYCSSVFFLLITITACFNRPIRPLLDHGRKFAWHNRKFRPPQRKFWIFRVAEAKLGDFGRCVTNFAFDHRMRYALRRTDIRHRPRGTFRVTV